MAIGLVLLCHFGNDQGLPDYINSGNLGVRIFFVLSGFLITGLMEREREKTNGLNVGRFYFRRTLRIFPAYYAFLAVMLLLSWVGVTRLDWADVLPSATYLSNYWKANAGATLSHTWSLSVEEQFYLLWPPLFWLLGRRASFVLVLAVCAAPVVRFVFFRHTYMGGGRFEAAMDALAVGSLLALWRGRLHATPVYLRLVRSWPLALLVAAGVTAVSAQSNFPTLQNTVGITAMNLAVAFLLDHVVTRPDTWHGRVLNLAPVRFVGVISYSIYLWQQPPSHVKFAEHVLELGDGWAWLGWWPVGLAATFAAAILSYYAIEKPALAVRDLLDRAMFNRNAKAVPAIDQSPKM